MTKLNEAQAVQIACIAFEKEALTKDVAALVDGVPVCAEHVDRYISVFRSMARLVDEKAWCAWLAENGTSENEVRRDTLAFLIDFKLMERAALEHGIVVLASDVDRQLESAAAMLGSTSELEHYVAERGLTMELYRRGIEANLSRAALVDRMASERDERGMYGRDGPQVDTPAIAEAFDLWFSKYRSSAEIVTV